MTNKLIMNRLLVGLAVLLGTTICAPGVRADEPQPGVARISLIHGDVSTQRGDSGDWAVGTVNTPVVAGDRLSTGTRSRAEVQLDFANVLRLDERAEAKIAELSRTRIQLQVREGLINYTVLKGSEADVEIDTPNVAVRPIGESSVRILVIEDQTRVIVRKGEAELTTPQGSTRAGKNQQITIRGSDNPEYQTDAAPGNDDWDNWNKQRDHQIQDAQSWSHTNRYYSGTEELDHNGRWVDVPGYGDVWQPAVSSDWAPYREGRWVWEPYYGWTWVSYESWGWAPYHYGRWFYHGSSWCWWPGPVYSSYYPVWAPAYVSFFGFGRHFGVSVGFGFGSVGWLPIGPSDFFFPWWGGGRRTVNVTNITNITNITNVTTPIGVRPFAPLASGGRPERSNLNGVLNNTRMQKSITTMPTEQFGKGPVRHDRETVTAEALRQGGVVAGSLPVVPTRESLRPVDREVNPSTMRGQTGKPERYFAKSQPTFTPQPFHEQAAQVEQVVQQHQAAMRSQQGASSGPARAAITERNPASAGEAVRGTANQPTGATPSVATPNPASRTATPAPAPGSAADRQTWHKFGPVTTDQPGRPRNDRLESGQPAAQPGAPTAVQPRVQSPASGSSTQQPSPGTPGWRKFSGPPQPSTRESSSPQQSRESNRPARPTPAPAPSPAPAPAPAPRPPAAAQDQGWQHFTPGADSRASSNADRVTSSGRPPVMEREQQRNWHPAENQVHAAPRTEVRPALDLHRQIVTPRSSSDSGGSSGGTSGGSSHGSSHSSAPSGSSHGSSSGSSGSGSSRPPHNSNRPGNT